MYSLVNVSLPLVLEKGAAIALDAMEKFGVSLQNLLLNPALIVYRWDRVISI